ncbi:MAG: FAD binding domain-containing protein [Thermoanaerobaculaceae bacterium]|nr:FAD binding domain-containing protein [Thermoanaerobaculaceae bacterium]MDI9623139.1 FAD binding domain-containing protein [Acidobacteriota bacterium]NLH10858.1 xanthine dehydrogenase family protein subunit M [Holophagae bacterium]HPW56554.1 FAD binding domain-containing protein [Thermoanaerobaculaceae bacterium]
MDLPVQDVLRPRSLREALRVLADHPGARPVAGGTDLVVQLRDGRRQAELLVDLSRVGLDGITETDRGIAIGAGTTMDVIATHRAVRTHFPALATAASQVGAWPIQCRATLGGNLANASPAADTAPALLVAGAAVTVASARGQSQLPLEELFVGPGRTSLRSNELIVSVLLPVSRTGAGRRLVERFVKVGPRREQIISVVCMAGRVVVAADGRLELVRLAFGSVAPTPVRARATERLLERRVLDDRLRQEALGVVQEDVKPIDDVRAPASYRRLAVATLLDRFLAEVARG